MSSHCALNLPSSRLCTEQPVGDGQRVLPDHVAQGLRVRISSDEAPGPMTDDEIRSSSLQSDAEGQAVMRVQGY